MSTHPLSAHLSPHFQNGAAMLAQVRNLRDVPTLSIILQELVFEIESRRATLERLTSLIARDQVLSAKVLRSVNASYYGREKPIADLKKAVHFLGEDTLKAIVFGTHTFKPEDLLLADRFDVIEFWRYCFATGLACELVAEKIGYARPAEMFTAGLLHDIGKLALLRMDRELFAKVVDRAAAQGGSFLAAEQEVGLPGHAVVGEALSEAWHLPLVARKLGRLYQRDISLVSSLYEDLRAPVMIGTLAISLVRAAGLGCWGDHAELAVPASYWDAANCRRETLEDAVKIAAEKSEVMREILRKSVVREAA